MSEIEQAEYIAQLNPMELRVLQIAKIQLQSSFSLVKSIGFINWQKKQKALALLVQAEVPIEVIIEIPAPVTPAPVTPASVTPASVTPAAIKKRLKIIPAKAIISKL